MAIFYVKKHEGPSQGTKVNPFHTLNEANDVAKDKDTVLVHGGTYHETLRLKTPGVNWYSLDWQAPVIDGRYSPGERLPNGNMPAEDAKKNYLPGSDYGKMVNITAERVTFSGFVIQNVAGQPLGILANGVTVSDCIIDFAYGGGINVSDCSGVSLINNVVQRCNQKRYDPTNTKGGPAGVQVTVLLKGVKNSLISGNEISFNHGEGLGVSLDSSDNLIQDNTIHTNLHMQMLVNHAQDNVFNANLIYHRGDKEFLQRSSGDPPAGIMITDEKARADKGSPSRGNTFTNNIVAFCSDNFNVRASKNSTGALRDTLVAHNTFWEATTENTEAFGIRIPPSDHSNSKFINNIVYQSTGTVALAPGGKGVEFRNNNWSRNPGDKAKGPGDTVGDPRLAGPIDREDMLALDFTPTAASELILGRAFPLASVPEDYFHDGRDGEKADIGAIEYAPDVLPEPDPDPEPEPEPTNEPVPQWVIEGLTGIIAQATTLAGSATELLERVDAHNANLST